MNEIIWKDWTFTEAVDSPIFGKMKIEATREELEEYVKNNRTPFSEFEKRLDYSKFTKSQEKKKSPNKTLWKKIGYALASVVLVIALSIGGYFIHTHVGDTKCPFEMGTYVYEYA